jgi:sulfofructose kinase
MAKMVGNKIDVLCVGHAAYDLYFSVPHHPGPDEKAVADQFVSCGGGPAANAAVTVARLGYKSAFAGYLGNDVFGEKHLQELIAEGVLTELVVRGSPPSPLSVIIVKPDGSRTLVNYRASTEPIKSSGIEKFSFTPKVILFDGLEPLISPSIADYARKNGIPTILDAGSLHQGSRTLSPLVDYLVCSEKFAHQYTGEEEPQKALVKLQQDAPMVVITLGARGLIWKSNRGAGHFPAFKIEVVDTTGAGDAFHGAFAVCLATGQSWEKTLRYSSAVAAFCCTKIGGRAGVPSRSEVEEFMTQIADTTD